MGAATGGESGASSGRSQQQLTGPRPSHQLPSRHTLPPPSPSWAEVAGGGGEERRGKLPPVLLPHHPSHSPSATSQFEAWLRCREEGIPAKLVLETDGTNEEVSLSFMRTARAPTAAHLRRRRRRPERDKKRRQQRAERRRAAQSNAPPQEAAAENGPPTVIAVDSSPPAGSPPAGSPPEGSPPAGSPPAKRHRTRAAARRGGQPHPPTPELSRAAAFASPCALNISVGEDLGAGREEPPDLHPPPSPSTVHGDGMATEDLLDDFFTSAVAADGGQESTDRQPIEDVTDEGGGRALAASAPCQRCNSCEADFEEDLWMDGRRLNARDPPWERVFGRNGKYCRFCRRNPEKPEGDGSCMLCENLTTFQLIVKFAERICYRYPKQY